MNQPNPMEAAKQGDASAIASLLNRSLKPQGITAKVSLKGDCLHVMLEAEQVPNQQVLVARIRNGINSLKAEAIKKVKVYGKQIGEEFPDWNEEFEVATQTYSNDKEYIKPRMELSSSLSVRNSKITKYATQNKENHKFIKADDYRVLLENEILYGSLGVLGFIFFILLGISFGLALVFVAVSAFWIKIKQAQLLGHGVKVSEKQLPDVYRVAQIASERLSMKMPDVFVVQNPEFNAYATGFLEDKKTVVIHSALVEALNHEELISIIGHEFSHIKCHHTNWMVLTNTAENVAKIPFISALTGFIFLLWSRKCEYTCDRGGLLASQNLQASISAFAKLAVGKQLFAQMNLDALIEQKKDVDVSEMSRISELFQTHPHIVNRIHELKKFHESSLYRRLIVK